MTFLHRAVRDLRPRFKIEISQELMLHPLPKWLRLWGVAWRPCDRFTYVLLPVPINYLVGWVRHVWFRLRGGYADRLAQAYERGRTDGFRSGMETQRKNDAMDSVGARLY